MAIFKDGRLEEARYVTNPEILKRGPSAWADMAGEFTEQVSARVSETEPYDAFVVETPQFYSWAKQKGDQDDLGQLYGVSGAILSKIWAREYVGFYPREWKGQVPKPIHNKRTLAALNGIERASIQAVPASLMHNVTDAIGIGLFYVRKIGARE